MKRTNSVTDALNAEAADIDLGDGLSMRLPLGDMVAVIGDAADAAKLAAVEASMGPKVVAIDTDGTPYYNPVGGTHRIFPDADGVPYYALNLWPATGTDTNGAPIITF